MERIEILEILVDNNTEVDGCATCPKVRINCPSIYCDKCPLEDRVTTLGAVREDLFHLTNKSLKEEEPVPDNGCGIASSIDTAVYNPKHYSVIGDIEAIELIARSMTVEMFKGYCLGNLMKYRLRLGAKDAVEQDLKKAQNYVDIFEKHKVLCYDYVS